MSLLSQVSAVSLQQGAKLGDSVVSEARTLGAAPATLPWVCPSVL